MLPPKITDATVPKSRAATPDSNDPSSFDEVMNILLTDDTRPRISSGVNNCIIVLLIITLTLSAAPKIKRKASDK